ncbi:MAG: hypothetical protein JNL79_04110 [Myxococcales bacterium]|nr:hypothetical protein [Myxococcales bacterium]
MTTNKRRVSIRRLMDEYAAINQLRVELGIQAADRARPVDGMLDDLKRAVAVIGQTARGRRVGVRLDVAALAIGERERLERIRNERAEHERAA